jgi:hypothetical protein
MLEIGITGHKFGRGPSKDHSTKVLLQLAQWFLRRRFLCEFRIGSYVKLSSAVGAILVEGPNRLTYFSKRTIQWLFHQKIEKRGNEIKKKSSPLKLLGQSQPNFAEVILGWSPSKIVAGISYLRPRCLPQAQSWKGAIQGPFHDSLVAIGPVVSEEKIFMWISHRVLY